MPQKDQDSAKFFSMLRRSNQILNFYLFLAPKAAWSTIVVDGPVVALKRSPFFKDVILIAGGWMFQIWKEKIHVSLIYIISKLSHILKIINVYFLIEYDN
jgi:hypothetical protein